MSTNSKNSHGIRKKPIAKKRSMEAMKEAQLEKEDSKVLDNANDNDSDNDNKDVDSEDDYDDDGNDESDSVSNDEGDYENDESDADDDDGGSDGEGRDGLADMMTKILNQNTGAKAPVLAKRKTALMKDIESHHQEAHDVKRRRLERKRDRTRQMTIPDPSTADFERQLRKLATRGVVALFNAIAKAKRDTVASSSASTPAVASTPASAVSAVAEDRAAKEPEFSANRNAHTQGTANAANDKAATSSSWAALKDDYLIAPALTVKHWDKATAESDSD